jgi:hypothetical protein
MITHTMINAGLRTGWPESMGSVQVQVVVGEEYRGVRAGRLQRGTVSDDSFLHAVDRARTVGNSGREETALAVREMRRRRSVTSA